jgi:hypothetical protein
MRSIGTTASTVTEKSSARGSSAPSGRVRDAGASMEKVAERILILASSILAGSDRVTTVLR